MQLKQPINSSQVFLWNQKRDHRTPGTPEPCLPLIHKIGILAIVRRCWENGEPRTPQASIQPAEGILSQSKKCVFWVSRSNAPDIFYLLHKDMHLPLSAQHAVYFRTIGEIWHGIWDVALKDLHRPGKPSCWGSSYHAWGLLQKSLGNRSEICGKSCGNPFCHKNLPFESRILLANRWDIISNDFFEKKKRKSQNVAKVVAKRFATTFATFFSPCCLLFFS